MTCCNGILYKQYERQESEIEKSLCPELTLKHSVHTAAKYRHESQKRLLISYVPGKNSDITKQTVSRYIKTIIQLAYQRADADPEPGPTSKPGFRSCE